MTRCRRDSAITTLEFMYDALPPRDFFRVLVLHPGHGKEALHCHLEIQSHRRLRSNAYEAISYVWGKFNETVPIRVNGQSFSISSNLRDALWRFRNPQVNRRLWADSICIDQSNEHERDQQVKRMGQVYAGAERVLVWLGRDDNGSAETCFDMIRTVNAYFGKLLLERGGHFHRDMPRLREPFPIPMDLHKWAAVAELTELQWFDRVWTVQESALARECRLFWGKRDIDIADVFETSLWCKRNHDLGEKLIETAPETAVPIRALHTKFLNMHAHYGSPSSWQYSRPGIRKDAVRYQETCLSLVLFSAWYLKATDPRDHVYAFLGSPYAKGSDGTPFVDVEYSKSLQETYLNVACSLLQHPREGPWVLSAVANNKRADVLQRERPTWVPQWNVPRSTNMLADPTYDLRAGGSDLARFSADVKSACLLEADGFVIDTVVWIAPSYGSNFRSTYESNWSLDTSSWSEAVRRAGKAPIDVLTDLASKAASQRNLDFNDTAFTLALVQGYYQADPDLERHRSSFENYRHVVRAAVLEAGGSGSVIFPDNVLQSATGTANALREHHRGKSVFLTKSGRFGLANSAAMEVRDVCCIFLGATVPFVLAPAGRGRYRLVGEAYLHGVMAGELVHQYKHGTVVLE